MEPQQIAALVGAAALLAIMIGIMIFAARQMKRDSRKLKRDFRRLGRVAKEEFGRAREEFDRRKQTDPKFAATVERVKSAFEKKVPELTENLPDLIWNFLQAQRSPETIKESIDKKGLLIKETELQLALDKLRKKESSELQRIADRMVALQKERDDVLRNVTDEKTARQIRDMYDAKIRALLRGEE